MVNEGCRHTPFANLIPLGSAYPPRCSYSPFSLFLENSKVQKNGEPQKSMPLRNRKAERRIRTTPKGAYFPGFPYTLKSFGRWAFNRLIFNDKKKFVGITKKSIFATTSLNLQIMTEFFDYFTKNYPQFVPLSTTALVCFFVYKFYLKAEGFSKEWTHFKDIYFPKFEERFVKSDDRFVILIKEMAELRKEMNERFVLLIEKLDERLAELRKEMNERFVSLTKEMNERFMILIEKSDERFAELRKEMNERFMSLTGEMNERFAKSDERLAELRKEMNERFLEFRKEMNERFLELRKEMNERLARIEERLAKSDERFVSLIEKMDERFLELRKEMNERFARMEEQFAELIEKLTVTH